MTLTVRLGPEEEKKLQDIEEALQTHDKSKLIRELINEKWASLQPTKTFVERRGGHPVNVLYGPHNASERSERKNKMAEHFSAKANSRKSAD